MKLLLLLIVYRIYLTKADQFDEVEYGETYRFYMTRRAHTVEFTPRHDWSTSVLWNQNEPENFDKKKFKVDGNYFVINRVTHRDKGVYTVLDDRGRTKVTQDIDVYTPTREYDLKAGEDDLYFNANLEKESCNIFFFPSGKFEIQIVENGRKMDHIDDISCVDFVFSEPCRLSNHNLQSSCSGYFEIRDEHGDIALKVLVNIQSFYPMYFAIGGFILVVIIISCCATRFCCGRNKSRKKPAAVSEPAIRYYEQEPVGPRSNQLNTPSRTRYPAESSTGPLIHDPPTVNVPPAYSSAFTRAHEPGGAVEPLCSDPEPRFELKGLNFNFASPLSSDSTQCDVYTSDKLNFL